MRDTLLFAGLVGFSSGILCRSFFFLPWQVPAFVLLLIGILLIAWIKERRVLYVVCAVALLGVVIGAGRVMVAPSSLPEAFASHVGTEVVFEGVVSREPDIRETTQRVTLEVENNGERTKVLAVAPLYPEIEYGSRVTVRGMLARPEPFETDAGRTFRYDRFLAKDGIFALVGFAYNAEKKK